jgi:hypothetical protein
MNDIFCPQCRLHQPGAHVFCVRCGTELPSHLLQAASPKRVRFFPGVRVADKDPEGAWLRVSCYLQEQRFSSSEGEVTIPAHHVRFSIWVENEALCALSIPETEARGLAAFITEELRHMNGGNLSYSPD